MANLKELRNRIKTVKSTQKMTAAMKMVAASKFRRFQNQLTQVRQSARVTEKMVNHLMSQPTDDPVIYAHPGKGSAHVLIVVGGDKGLCGAYNTNILKEARECLTTLMATKEPYILVPIGKKVQDGLKHFTNNNQPLETTPESLARWIMDEFHQGTIQTVRIISPRFRNVLMQQIKTTFLLPYVPETYYVTDCPTYILTEPNSQKFLPLLFQKNLESSLNRLFFESITCEHAARMTAMDGATQNASDMIGKLQLLYNQSRQAQITSELIEIISGAQAAL
jgi:F-type H+-transporting ATPase subunit gamma